MNKIIVVTDFDIKGMKLYPEGWEIRTTENEIVELKYIKEV